MGMYPGIKAESTLTEAAKDIGEISGSKWISATLENKSNDFNIANV